MDYFPVFLHILEEGSLKETNYSCVPRTGVFPPDRQHVEYFETEDEFQKAALAAFARILRSKEPAARHLLIISAHGERSTGTHVHLHKGKRAFSLSPFAKIFEIRPETLVVFVSTCWGAYQSILQTLRSGSHTPKPITIGPIVNIHPRHANQLQRRIVQILCQEREIEDLLVTATVTESNSLHARHGQAVWRIVKRDGTSIPEAGQAGLAEPMRRSMAYRVVALQRLRSNTEPEPDVVVLLGADGKYWRIPFALIRELISGDAYDFMGRSCRLRGKELRYEHSTGLGDLVDICEVTLEPKPPRFFEAYRPPYPHAIEPSVVRTEGEPVAMSVGSAKTCKRCNWASVAMSGIRRGGVTTYDVRTICHRKECPEHCKTYSGTPHSATP